MNALTRWDPFREMEELQRRFASVFDWAPFRRGELRGEDESMTVAQWAPLVDIAETDKEYLIKVELPEVNKNDVKVAVEHGTLTISGERKSEKVEKGLRFHRVERYQGRFERSFRLPDDADQSKVTAEASNGVLQVHVAKNEKARPKQIEVKIE